MSRSTRGTLALIAALALVVAPVVAISTPAASSAAPTAADYTFFDITSPVAGSVFLPNAVADGGVVIGQYGRNSQVDPGGGAVWQNGTLTTLAVPAGSTLTQPESVSSQGVIVGSYRLPSDQQAGIAAHTAVWSASAPGTVTSLPAPVAGGRADFGLFVNASGQFAASGVGSTGANVAFLAASASSAPVQLGTGFGPMGVSPSGFADSDSVLGLSDSGSTLMLLTRSGTSTAAILPTPDASPAASTVLADLRPDYPLAISGNGTVVGTRASDLTAVIRTPAGVETALPAVEMRAVNDSGAALGEGAGSQAPLLIVNGVATTVQSLLPTGWTQVFADGFDNAGDIVGVGFANGSQHAFLLKHGAADAPLTINLAAAPSRPAPGQTATVTATITNPGTSAVTGVSATLAGVPATHLTVGAPSPASVGSLGAGASTTVTWSVSADVADTYAVTGTVNWTTAVGSAASATAMLSLPVAVEGIVVNSTADAPLTALATTNRVCDTDDATAGNQCTFRAAIQTANLLGADGTAQAITFNIPGSGVPTITPATALPTLTVPAVVDGSTQASGWVNLSGASSSGDGLTVTGGGTTIRGFVLNGFANGSALVLSGAGHDTVVGNRIGTNVAGTAAVANKYGIQFSAPDTLIGATTSDGTLLCAGDCNLISGNANAIRTDEHQPAPARSRIVGNFIGTDMTGQAAIPNVVGIALYGTVGLSQADMIDVGGSTQPTGLAPGNVISGNTLGIELQVVSQREPQYLARVRGNLIDGRNAPAGSQTKGIDNTNSSSDVGGGGTGDGNVIIGFQTGIDTGGSQGDLPQTNVRGNSIGVGPGGVVVRNTTGVRGGTLCDNVISGNSVGVDNVRLAGGNRIGTNAAGTAAIANSIGATGVVTSVSTSDCPGRGPDVVSGNSQAGFGGYFSGLDLSDIYIGTNATGTAAIPNAVGISFSDDDAPGSLQLGLGRNVDFTTRTNCAFPCVVIAGNAGDGVAITEHSGAYLMVTHTNIGAGADGRSLGNGGDGIHTESSIHTENGSGAVLSSIVGIEHNLIANNAQIGLDLHGTDPEASGYPIRDNTISDNPGGGISLADGGHFLISGNTIHSNAFGVKVVGGDAPEVIGNSFAGNNVGYNVGVGTNAFGAPAGSTAKRVGTTLVMSGSRPAGSTGAYRIDVYGDAECTTGAQGSVYLSSVTVPSSLLSTSFSVQVNGVPASTTGIEVAATDISSASATTPGSTGRYTGCVTPAATTQQARVSANLVAPGSNVIVAGSGFAPGEQVDVSLHSTPVHLATVTADANGEVSARVVIPSKTPAGLHHIVLTGLTSGVTAEIALTVTRASTARGSSLATTGTDPMPLALLAGGLLLVGFALRRRKRARS